MKITNKAIIGLCLLLTIAILTAGTASALKPMKYSIYEDQLSDKYSYYFEVVIKMNQTLENGNDYFWDFGDGTYSYNPKPYHTYTSSGEKIVTVRFNDPLGEQYLSKSVYPGV
jgi:PKD repeat protein